MLTSCMPAGIDLDILHAERCIWFEPSLAQQPVVMGNVVMPVAPVPVIGHLKANSISSRAALPAWASMPSWMHSSHAIPCRAVQ